MRTGTAMEAATRRRGRRRDRSGIAGFQWTSASNARRTIRAGYRYYDKAIQHRRLSTQLGTTRVECETENERHMHQQCFEDISQALQMSTIGPSADPIQLSEALLDCSWIAPFGGNPSA